MNILVLSTYGAWGSWVTQELQRRGHTVCYAIEYDHRHLSPHHQLVVIGCQTIRLYMEIPFIQNCILSQKIPFMVFATYLSRQEMQLVLNLRAESVLRKVHSAPECANAIELILQRLYKKT